MENSEITFLDLMSIKNGRDSQIVEISLTILGGSLKEQSVISSQQTALSAIHK